jgi:CheY-like chemotaxis protein
MKMIFLADDDTDDVELFHDALHEIAPDIELHVAFDGASALNKLESAGFPIPDLIFLDINMPLVDGWECLQRVRQTTQFREVPVMMYSTSCSHRDMDIASKLGASHFITKPTNFNELKVLLSKIVIGELERKLPKEVSDLHRISDES